MRFLLRVPGPHPALGALSTGLLLVTLAGCATSSGEDDAALAERYAREESRLIDEKAFAQARERSRVQRDARRRLGEDDIVSAPPLDIDPSVGERWQFGTLPHPLSGIPVCAAVSGHALPYPSPASAAPRLAVLADGVFVTSEAVLVVDRTESAVRIDGGLPIPLELTADGRVARLVLAPDRLHARLRAGTVATLSVAIGSDPETPAAAFSTPVDDGPAERIIGLDGLGPMLDELARCAT